MSQTTSTRRKRFTVLTVAVLFVALAMMAGSATAHNPACHQTAGADGPHYDDDERTGSDTAFEKNPTLGGEFNENAADSCSVGNSQSPRSDN